jgi:hypothetical protein
MSHRFCLHRFNYSAHPWRLAWHLPDGQYCPLPYPGLHWPRKRDALPTFTALQALQLDWSPPGIAAWTDEDHDRVWTIIAPLVEAWHAEVNTTVARVQQR